MAYKPIKRSRINKISKDELKKNTIDSILEKDEILLWSGRPNKTSYGFTSVLRLLPFVLFCLIFFPSFLPI